MRAVERRPTFIVCLPDLLILPPRKQRAAKSNDECNYADHMQNVMVARRAGMLHQRVADEQVGAPRERPDDHSDQLRHRCLIALYFCQFGHRHLPTSTAERNKLRTRSESSSALRNTSNRYSPKHP